MRGGVGNTALELANSGSGYYIYGLSMAMGFHSTTLLLNPQEPNNPRFRMYDQHGTGSSNYMNAKELDKAITQYIKRHYPIPTQSGEPGKTTIKLWQIKP